MFQHGQETVAARWREVLTQAYLLDEVQVGVQYLVGSVPRKHTDEERYYTFYYKCVAFGAKVKAAFLFVAHEPHAALAAVYQAQSGGQPVGYAINVEASGSQGTISMMVGIDMDGAVTGVSIVTNSETSGIGSKVMSNEPLTNGTRVLDQFIGKSAADGVLSVGSNVDAITGATVSTKGVTTGVNAALAAAGVIG